MENYEVLGTIGEGCVPVPRGPLLIANAKVWTPANLLIYNAPLQYRVLAANAIDLVWAAICSETAAECARRPASSRGTRTTLT